MVPFCVQDGGRAAAFLLSPLDRGCGGRKEGKEKGGEVTPQWGKLDLLRSGKCYVWAWVSLRAVCSKPQFSDAGFGPCPKHLLGHQGDSRAADGQTGVAEAGQGGSGGWGSVQGPFQGQGSLECTKERFRRDFQPFLLSPLTVCMPSSHCHAKCSPC